MLKLIVHADDFGLTQKVNQGIVLAYQKGILTSTSIVANGRAFAHAIDLCRQNPSLDIGIHLTMVEEQPLLPRGKVLSLIDEKGMFFAHAVEFIKKYFAGKIMLDEVENELEEQIKKVLEHGINVSHLDSHQHLHMLPQISRIVSKLGEKYGIKAVRVPQEEIRLYMFKEKNSLSRIIQQGMLNRFCWLSKNRFKIRTDHFAGFFFGGNLNSRNMQKVIQSFPDSGICELMCHPGIDDPQSSYRHWSYHWQEELEALINPQIIRALKERRVDLINYSDLPLIEMKKCIL